MLGTRYKSIRFGTEQESIQKILATNRSVLIREVCSNALLPFIITRMLLVSLGVLVTYFLLPLQKPVVILPSLSSQISSPGILWNMWNRFDSGFFLGIAQNGYWSIASLHSASNWVFFPLYPLLIKAVAIPVGGNTASYTIAGVLVSNILAVLGIGLMYILVRKEFGKTIATCSVLFLGVFPTAFYLDAIYSESLFLFCAVACLYFTREHKWLFASLCGGLAALTRSQGIGLLVPMIWEWWYSMYSMAIGRTYGQFMSATLSEESKTYGTGLYICLSAVWKRMYFPFQKGLTVTLQALHDVHTWRTLATFGFIPLGSLLFMGYAYVQTGDFRATIHTEHWGWGRYFENPLTLLMNTLQHPIGFDPMNWNFWSLNVLCIAFFLGATIWAFRKLPLTYAFFTLVMVLFPLTTAKINSVSRFYMTIFPVFMLLALWANPEEHPLRVQLITITCVLAQGVFFVFFLLGLPAIA